MGNVFAWCLSEFIMIEAEYRIHAVRVALFYPGNLKGFACHGFIFKAPRLARRSTPSPASGS